VIATWSSLGAARIVRPIAPIPPAILRGRLSRTLAFRPLAPEEPGDDGLSTGGKSFWIRTGSVMIRPAASDSQAAALLDPKAEL
jgi:hypothetical protein